MTIPVGRRRRGRAAAARPGTEALPAPVPVRGARPRDQRQPRARLRRARAWRWRCTTTRGRASPRRAAGRDRGRGRRRAAPRRDAPASCARCAPPSTSSAGTPRGLRLVAATTAIPQGRGLGSSAAAIVAGIVGAWALCPDVEALDDDAVAAAGHRDRGAPRQRRRLPARRLHARLDGRRPARAAVRLDRGPRIVPGGLRARRRTLSTDVARGLLPDAGPARRRRGQRRPGRAARRTR